MRFCTAVTRSSLALGLVSLAVLAQTPPPQVTFNVVAFDAKGAPLRDLRADDLRIEDDGKAMRPVFFRPLESAALPSPPLGPREFSNRAQGKTQTTLILFDLLNANLEERGAGWNELGHNLQKLESAGAVYFYLLTKDATLYPIHALPDASSPDRPDDPSWTAQAQALLNRAMQAVNRLRPQEFQADADARTRKSLNVLRDLASYLAVQPGRKSLVWVSHGVPLFAKSPDGMHYEYTSVVQSLGADLAHAGIAIYAVDQSDRSTPGLNSLDTLQLLSDTTGGVWLSNNEVDTAIRQALTDGAATYELSYIPPADRWDNKFHKLRVTTSRKGARLRAMNGYFGDAREMSASQRFSAAALGSVDATGIAIRATATPSRAVPGWTHFQIRIDGGDPTHQYTLRFVNYTTAWQPIISGEMSINPDATLSLDRPAAEGVRKIRAVVRDTTTGAVGSLTIPFTDAGTGESKPGHELFSLRP